MVFPVGYLAADYQPRGQILLKGRPNQRIDLADGIYLRFVLHSEPIPTAIRAVVSYDRLLVARLEKPFQ